MLYHHNWNLFKWWKHLRRQPDLVLHKHVESYLFSAAFNEINVARDTLESCYPLIHANSDRSRNNSTEYVEFF